MYVVHWKKAEYDVYIARPSKWGNPYTHIGDRQTRAEFILATRKQVMDKYEEYLFSSHLINDIEELRGKILGCWCYPKSCHGDILAKYANGLKLF
jgi:uncharacterized protein DUF4326